MHTIGPEQVKQILTGDEATPVINVLDREHFEDKHIPGSVNVPLGSSDFVEKVTQRTPDKSASVVVYCASKSCDASERAAEQLERAGFSKVLDFQVGMEGWETAGYRAEGRQTTGGG
jgi:rhodanese-related sulfurtransferase